MAFGGSTKLGEAVLDVRADTKQLKRDLDDAKKTSSSTVAGMAKGMRGLAAGGGVGVLAAGFWKASQAGSDLNESINKARVTFGSAAKDMPGFGSSVAESLGMARAEALDAAAGIGSMLIPMGVSQGEAAKMSARMTTLAADLGSFHNADPTEMLDRLRAGLSGESEPLKRFGIVLNETRVQQEAVRMGLVAHGETLTDAEKIQARYSLAIRDAGKANGDFARTSDGAANQQRVLKAELADLQASIGTALLPVLSAGIAGLRGLVGFLSTHQGTIRAVAATIRDAFVQAIKAVEPTVRSLVETVQSVVNTVRALWERFGSRIVAVAREHFGIVRAVVQGALNAVRDVIGLVLAVIRGDWSEAWTRLVSLVRGVLTTMADVAKRILTGLGPALARLALAAGQALAGSLWSGIKSRLGLLSGLVGEITSRVSSAVSSAAASVAEVAQAIGSAIAGGVVSGLKAMAGWVVSQLTSWASSVIPGPIKRVLGIASPSRVMEKEVGEPTAEGVAKGVMNKRKVIAAKLTSAVVDAIRSARDNATGLASELGSMIGQAIDARAQGAIDALKGGPEGSRLAQIEQQQGATGRAREEARLRGAIDDAAAAMNAAGPEGETPAERAERVLEAQQGLADALVALSDWQLEEEARLLRESLADQERAIRDREDATKASAERSIADLTDAFARGTITQAEFAAGLNDVLLKSEVDAKAAGALLGSAFGNAFKDTLAALLEQSVLLGDVPAARGQFGEPGVDPFATAMSEWRDRDKKLAKALDKAKDTRPEEGAPQKAWNDYRTRVQTAQSLLDAHRAQRPTRLSRMAYGGILDSPTYALLAERGYPEAAIPLDGSRRSWALLDRARSALAARSGGDRSSTHNGPLVNVQTMSVRAPEDAALVAARLSRQLAKEGVW